MLEVDKNKIEPRWRATIAADAPERVPDSLAIVPAGYAEWLADVKARVHAAQQRAALALNTEVMQLYWQLGRDILGRQGEEGWGAKVTDRLAHDLKMAFPEVKGLSPRNLKYLRRFAETWPEREIRAAAAAQIAVVPPLHPPRLAQGPDRSRLVPACVHQYGWSHSVLAMQIEIHAYKRRGQALTNFGWLHLPKPQSDLARESWKGPVSL